ncbi:putative vacuolar sorting receptor [Microthyrium microscopicum]|uniref:Putative vacuolar sorting receptor n=1 Tax=Microthyrium microscopicum TaxID=703497 RepID=A0A6A6TVE4_9PEZI|nr:putative vacuolar sorting receptor [Microthyrium microscopicum]
MMFSSLWASLALALALPAAVVAAAEKKPPPPDLPCTIHSPAGNFFDLRPLQLAPAKSSSKVVQKELELGGWQARGYDYGANFTVNFCGPVVHNLTDVQGVDKELWRNVSAFYDMNGKTYSIGSANGNPIFRGRKLVLNYTGGSPCDSNNHKRSLVSDLEKRASDPKASAESPRRKSTIISLLCDSDHVDPKVTVAFVGADESQCSYFFEARSVHACAGIETTPQQLGPGGVFSVILLIALVVYFVGGCVYQRTVMHQRGWRQLPNYTMWAGIFGLGKDAVLMLSSTCMRLIPGRSGYSRVSLNGNSRSRGIHSNDDENRLIDQLDDEWDD